MSILSWIFNRSAAASLTTSAGILAIALAAGCDRSSEQAGMEGEAPPPMDESAGSADPAPSAAGGGDPYGEDPAGGDPYAEDPQGATDPAGDAPPPAPQGHPGMGEAQAAEPVSDEEIEEFAAAYLQVEDVQEELEAELRAAESQEEAQAIQQRAMGEMQEAVNETGMDFETYAMLAQRLQGDPELIQRVEETIESMR